MLYSAAGKDQNQPLWSGEAPQGVYSPVLEGPGTVGAGGGGGVLGGRKQEQRPRVEPPGVGSENDCSFLAWEAGCVGAQSEPDWGGRS